MSPSQIATSLERYRQYKLEIQDMLSVCDTDERYDELECDLIDVDTAIENLSIELYY